MKCTLAWGRSLKWKVCINKCNAYYGFITWTEVCRNTFVDVLHQRMWHRPTTKHMIRWSALFVCLLTARSHLTTCFLPTKYFYYFFLLQFVLRMSLSSSSHSALSSSSHATQSMNVATGGGLDKIIRL